MKSRWFLENFGPIATAPNGVSKLREIILSLALQGKLVKQSSMEIPASELLKEIEAEKQRLVKEKTIKTPRPLLGIGAEEACYALPTGWEWVRFGEVAQHNSGKTLDKRRNTGLPHDYITTSNVYWGRFDLVNVRQMLIRDDELERCTAKKGDLLICEGGEAGRAAVWFYDKEVCFQNHVHRARFYCGIDPYYAYRFFEKLNATGKINQYRKGVGISNMSGKALTSIAFPLPPLAEQKRIVAKVDDLMALCDKLEVQQQERERRFPVLSRACHARSTESPTRENLKAIFDEVGTVSSEDVRQTINVLAVTGRLTIQEESERVDAVFKKSPMLSSPALDKTGFPSNWHTHPLNAVADVIVDCPHSTPKWTSTGKICVRTNQFRPGELDLSLSRYVSEVTYVERTQRLVPDHDDILYSREGGILGVACRVPPDVDLCLGQRMMLVRSGAATLPAYLELVLNSPLITGLAKEKTTGGAAPRVNMRTVRAYPIPVPPIPEQHRIIAKVDQLIALVDRVEQQQTKKNEVAEAFAQAAVSTITGTEIKEQKKKMKAPKTGLVSRLRAKSKPRATDQAPLADLLDKNQGELAAKALWQQSGLEIDSFYQQLKTEMAQGWIIEPEKARMTEIEAD